MMPEYGRPFILAGHSPGPDMLLYLLSEYMEEHPDVYARMVAATEAKFHLKPLTNTSGCSFSF